MLILKCSAAGVASPSLLCVHALDTRLFTSCLKHSCGKSRVWVFIALSGYQRNVSSRNCVKVLTKYYVLNDVQSAHVCRIYLRLNYTSVLKPRIFYLVTTRNGKLFGS